MTFKKVLIDSSNSRPIKTSKKVIFKGVFGRYFHWKRYPSIVNKKFCKVALSSLKSFPTPCPCSLSLLFSEAKTKRPGALEPGIQSSRSVVEMITRLTMSQRSYPICYKNPFLASAHSTWTEVSCLKAPSMRISLHHWQGKTGDLHTYKKFVNNWSRFRWR